MQASNRRITTKPPTYLFRYIAMSKSKKTKIQHRANPLARRQPHLHPNPMLRSRCIVSVKGLLGPGANIRKGKMSSSRHFLRQACRAP